MTSSGLCSGGFTNRLSPRLRQAKLSGRRITS